MILFLFVFGIGCSTMPDSAFHRADGMSYSEATLASDEKDCKARFSQDRMAFIKCMSDRGWVESPPSTAMDPYSSFDPGK
jgi:hypothetical protein